MGPLVIYGLQFSLLLIQAGCSDFQHELGHIRPRASEETQATEVKRLIKRLINEKERNFHITIDESLFQLDKDVFTIIKEEDEGLVRIKGSSGVAAAWGFHHYLKYFCGCHVSWDADQLSLPDVLPPANLTIVANDRFRYYQNVCTTSYSFVWWNLDRWVREVDWMALNGINLALAFNGQEEIWRRIYTKLGMNESEIDQHFPGPAFLAWIFPNATLQPLTEWSHFKGKYCCPYLISPQDPLFQRIGKLFLDEYISEFGTDHIYNCDTFNEMDPSSGSLQYLADVGKSIYKGMTSGDPNAIWMLQGWIFHNSPIYWTKDRARAFLTSVPIGKMIVLDLHAESDPQYKKLDSFFGQPYIWCMLHNFGGTLGLYGRVSQVNQGPFDARDSVNSTMVGTGLTPEGINQNYVVYDLMNEMSWRKTPASFPQWFHEYSSRRYGVNSNSTKEMWTLLSESVYDDKNALEQHGKYIFVLHPSLRHVPNVWYNASIVMKAWDKLVEAIDVVWQKKNRTIPETFLYDSVDITRQALQLLLDDAYVDIVTSYHQKNNDHFLKSATTFLELMDSMETVLSSHRKFLLRPWIESAKSLATDKFESDLYEMNARNQITLWGPKGEIKDYANKQWAGLVHHYYAPRWKMFFSYVEKALTGQITFNQSEIENLIFEYVESPFTYETVLNETYLGNTTDIVKLTYSKWRPNFNLLNYLDNQSYVILETEEDIQ